MKITYRYSRRRTLGATFVFRECNRQRFEFSIAMYDIHTRDSFGLEGEKGNAPVIDSFIVGTIFDRALLREKSNSRFISKSLQPSKDARIYFLFL